jgi:RNA polymerase sigma factor (sigma-70 family)
MTDRPLQLRFEALLREHRKIVLKVAALYMRDAEDRGDLEQEICVQLWRSFGSYDAQRAKFSTWMYRVALNVAISQVRRRRRMPLDRIDPLNEVHVATIATSESSPEEEGHFTELYEFVRQLDGINRALVLLYLEDRRYEEIAEILGISETNVSTKISRIKQRLRERIKASS